MMRRDVRYCVERFRDEMISSVMMRIKVIVLTAAPAINSVG
jgi:hypothetical protein